MQEIKQHKKTLESGSLGSDVLVVGSSQKMPRQSIFGEDYGLIPTLPSFLHVTSKRIEQNEEYIHRKKCLRCISQI